MEGLFSGITLTSGNDAIINLKPEERRFFEIPKQDYIALMKLILEDEITDKDYGDFGYIVAAHPHYGT